MADINALTLKVERLSQNADWWNSAMVWALVFAALAAIAVFVTTRIALLRTRQAAEVQSELTKAKEAQLSMDLKAKDQRIAELGNEAAQLNETAQREQLARIQLEKKVAWRAFDKEQQQAFVSSLSRFAGEFGVCGFLGSDMEAFSFSSDIAAALREAKWQVIPPDPDIIELQGTLPPTTASTIKRIHFGVSVASTSDAISVSAAHAVVRELDSLGYDAQYDSTAQQHSAPAVWITVQHRPLGAQGDKKLRAAAKSRTN